MPTRRLPLILGIAVLLLCAGVIAVTVRNRPLVLVTERAIPRGTGLVFSAHNIGYPALESEGWVRYVGGKVRWLDETGRVMPVAALPYYVGMTRVSPRRRYMARILSTPYPDRTGV